MVDYSCAIKLATPISVISAMKEAAARKIMIQGREIHGAVRQNGHHRF